MDVNRDKEAMKIRGLRGVLEAKEIGSKFKNKKFKVSVAEIRLRIDQPFLEQSNPKMKIRGLRGDLEAKEIGSKFENQKFKVSVAEIRLRTDQPFLEQSNPNSSQASAAFGRFL